MSHETPTKSRPGWRSQRRPGLADQKDTDRLMDIMPERADNAPPRQSRPSVCPICAMYADNGVITRAEVTATATYLDTAGHMWSVTWLEVA
jgi:hypothetical protein